MISVEQALDLVQSKCDQLGPITLDVNSALGYVLAKDIYSPINMPPFPQSAMDGYAVNFNSVIDTYAVIGEVAAGESGENYNLNEGEAVRIFTGAPVSSGANVVIKQEIVKRNGDAISFTEPITFGHNIRPLGEQIKVGSLAIEAGKVLTPAGVGFLCGIGITEVLVVAQPKITIIATGNELVKPGNELTVGKIYESNSYMLSAALNQYRYENHSIVTIGDTYEETLIAINRALEASDVLVLSGGISVGDYDFVGKALLEIGVEQIFYKVKQKPGKPLFMGKMGKKIVFALPGNPAAAMTSFYTYVVRGLNLMSGKKNPGLKTQLLSLKERYEKKGDRAEFLKATIEGEQIEILTAQSSAMLKSFAVSNALVYLPADYKGILPAGEKVKTYLL
jgi:molybdopterin molybdotransferase